MVDDIILGGIVVLLAVGFYLTRGAGGMPGGLEDPARNQIAKYTLLGDRAPEAGGDVDLDREREVK
jgi:hypothetical protein